MSLFAELKRRHVIRVAAAYLVIGWLLVQVLDLAAKHQFKIGHAWFDKNRCLPYARGIECIVCEEHCPTPEKAIKFKNVDFVTEEGAVQQVRQPFVDDALCIGCGICEYQCPMEGEAAIRVAPVTNSI